MDFCRWLTYTPITFFAHRGLAQLASAPGLGPGGHRFESCNPDHCCQSICLIFVKYFAILFKLVFYKKMHQPRHRLDTIFVVDSFCNSETGRFDRAGEIADLLSEKAGEVRVVEMDLARRGEIATRFQADLKEQLASGKGVMVLFNCPSAVSGGILAVTRATEIETANVTRKILLSCHGTSHVNRGFKRRGVDRDGIRHVVYDHDRRTHQQKLLDLFSSGT